MTITYILHIAVYNKAVYFNDNFIIKLMNDYLTPRRRHSSLFQRMEDEINKISRKLSAAKQHRQAHTHTPLQQTHTASSYNHTHGHTHAKGNESPGLTVRRNKEQLPPSSSKELTRKWNGLADRTNLQPKRPPIRRLRFSHRAQEVENLYEPNYQLWQQQQQKQRQQKRQKQQRKQREEQRQEAMRLQQQKIQLQNQLLRMKAICEQQSFKLGYLRSENREMCNRLQSQRMDSFREQLYLGKLVEGYKIKVGKYKQILNQEESLEIDIRDL